MVRTQIMIPRGLRRQIDAAKAPSQSLADYLREAATQKLKNDQINQKLTRLKRQALADRLIGSLDISKYPEWSTTEKIINWQKEMRAEWDRD